MEQSIPRLYSDILYSCRADICRWARECNGPGAAFFGRLRKEEERDWLRLSDYGWVLRRLQELLVQHVDVRERGAVAQYKEQVFSGEVNARFCNARM